MITQNDLLNFLMYVQIASTDSYMATQNCIQNAGKPSKLKVPTKSKSKIFENIFVAVDHYHKDTGVVHRFTEIAIFIATPVKKHV